MSTSLLVHRAANQLYQRAFPIYRFFYAAYKTYADRAERELLRKLLFQGSIVVDVGANIGIYSEFLSRCVGPAGLVHAFEPSPDNFRRLSAVTRHLSNLRVTRAAVGERSCESKLYVSDKLNVDHRAYKAPRDSGRPIDTQMVALDDYFKLGQRVDLIKMDIQGYELHALRGAQRVLEENLDVSLLLEFWPAGLEQAGVTWQELVEMLRGLGMSLSLVRNNGLCPFDAGVVRTDVSSYVNIFARRAPCPID